MADYLTSCGSCAFEHATRCAKATDTSSEGCCKCKLVCTHKAQTTTLQAARGASFSETFCSVEVVEHLVLKCPVVTYLNYEYHISELTGENEGATIAFDAGPFEIERLPYPTTRLTASSYVQKAPNGAGGTHDDRWLILKPAYYEVRASSTWQHGTVSGALQTQVEQDLLVKPGTAAFTPSIAIESDVIHLTANESAASGGFRKLNTHVPKLSANVGDIIEVFIRATILASDNPPGTATTTIQQVPGGNYNRMQIVPVANSSIEV